MKKKVYIISSIVAIVLIVFSFAFYKTFYTAHRDIASEEAQIAIMASELQLNYAKDYAVANKNYVDKVIETTGKITDIEQNTIVLDNMVQIDFLDKTIANLISGQLLTIKGRCVGYDDLLEVVKIDQAIVIINKQ